MAEASVTQAVDVPVEKVWGLVADFGDTSWMPGPGGNVSVEGSGPGMVRRIDVGDKVIVERLEACDDAGRSLVYTIPENVPFPATDYRATIRVREAGDGCEVEWSCSFEPDGVPEADVVGAIEGMYGVMIGWIRDRAKSA